MAKVETKRKENVWATEKTQKDENTEQGKYAKKVKEYRAWKTKLRKKGKDTQNPVTQKWQNIETQVRLNGTNAREKRRLHTLPGPRVTHPRLLWWVTLEFPSHQILLGEKYAQDWLKTAQHEMSL